MNYYNPYYFMAPTEMTGVTRGILGRGINFSTLLNGAQRTLGLINQAIPIVKEAAPMMRNAKTMFRVMNEFKKMDAPSEENTNTSNETKEEHAQNYNISDGGPTFFA